MTRAVSGAVVLSLALLAARCGSQPTASADTPKLAAEAVAKIPALEAGLKRDPADVKVMAELARAHWTAGHFDKAEEWYRAVVSRGADVAMAADYADVLLGRGRYLAARTVLRTTAGKSGAPGWTTEALAELNRFGEPRNPPLTFDEGSERVDNSLGGTLIRIPGGAFVRGADDFWSDHAPPRTITVGPFFIAEKEFTLDEFAVFDRETGWTGATPMGYINPLKYLQPSGTHPVAGISWEDARAVAIWLSVRENAVYRLPTEAEWEFAARGTDGRRNPWGNERGTRGEHGNWWRGINGRRPQTTPVGSFPKDRSPFGLLDMAGNVAEWCLDEYHPTYYAWSPDVNPYGSLKSNGVKVLRGGSWNTNGRNFAISRRRAARNQAYTGYGFRLVRELSPRRQP